MYNVSVGAVDRLEYPPRHLLLAFATRSQPEGLLSSTRLDSTSSGSRSCLALVLCLFVVLLRIIGLGASHMFLLPSTLLLPAMLGWSPMTSPSLMRSRMTSMSSGAPSVRWLSDYAVWQLRTYLSRAAPQYEKYFGHRCNLVILTYFGK